MAAIDPGSTPHSRTWRQGAGVPGIAVAATALAVAMALHAGPAVAIGDLGTVDILARPSGRVLPVHPKDGRQWIVGAPGQEYGIRVCNTTDGRVLAVMSVDGVNVVSGDTASPAQSGYVLDARECADINGWRKSLASTAAFYFTELPDAYAARTGRPENVGVVGVAFFRERMQFVTRKDLPRRLASSPEADSAAGSAMAGEAAADSATAGAPMARQESAQAGARPAPAAKIGTGHGRHETSYVQTTRFERASASPDETVVIHYDRRENLIAMGILPPPTIARSPNPFPAWTPRFVPDPPAR
jgi:hypothetical protein